MKKMSLTTGWFLLLMGMFNLTSLANERPESLIYYDTPGATALVVSKSECFINVFKFQQKWELIQKFECTTGKKNGDKVREGDLKTPTGIYKLSDTWSGQELVQQYGSSAEIYGDRAYELNYPNYLDKLIYRKTGYGIWLHGTNQSQPIATRGCVSTANESLAQLHSYIELNKTPFIVEEQITYISNEDAKRLTRELLKFLESWRQAWEEDQTEKYLSLYSKEFLTSKFNHQQWLAYKRRVNQRNQNRKIQLRHISILKSKNIYQIQFTQDYRSSRFNSKGQKHLYVQQHQDSFQILSETWESSAIHSHLETVAMLPPTNNANMVFQP